MKKEVLIAVIKQIAGLMRAGDREGAYHLYCDLFSNPEFMECKPEDQRQALKLMVLAKGNEKSLAVVVEAHRAALVPLTELVSRYSEAADHEMLGACHVVLGNFESAAAIFRAGLDIERARNAGSDLCGSLMVRLSAI